MSFTTAAAAAVNRHQIFEKTVKILNAHSLHFISLTLLFLPLTFAVSTAVNLHIFYTFSQTMLTFKTLTILLAVTVTVTVFLFTVAVIALITYSTQQSLHRKPVTFMTTFKSLSHSFVPLLFTFIAEFIQLSFIFIVISLSPLAVTEALKSLNLGFHVNQFVISTIGVITVLFFIVIWGLAGPISVLEGKYGFIPLRESSDQSIHFRYISFSILLLPLSVILSFYSYHVSSYYMGTNWHLIVQVSANYLMFLLMNLMYVVENTVLFLESKVMCGEETGNTMVEEDVFEKDDDDDTVLPQGFTYMMLTIVITWVITLFIMLV